MDGWSGYLLDCMTTRAPAVLRKVKSKAQPGTWVWPRRKWWLPDKEEIVGIFLSFLFC